MTERIDTETSTAQALRRGGEAALLLLAVGPAWAFAAGPIAWEFATTAAVAVLLALWAAHAAVTRAFRLRPDVVSVSLAGLVLWSAAQLVPLPLGVVRVVSPGAAAVHETYRPEVEESLPGEPPGGPRASTLPLSVDPDATRTFAVQVLGLLLVYAAARCWLGNSATFRRLAWAATLNGVALSVLALAQLFSSPPHTVFWTVPVRGSSFGPFINRNHFPDYIAGCVGLGIGLTLTLRVMKKGDYGRDESAPSLTDRLLAPFRYLDQPGPFAAAMAVAVMVAAVLFSLSRGGVLATAVAGAGAVLLARRRSSDAPSGLAGWGVGVAVVLAVGLAGWFGMGPVKARFATLFDVKEADDRTHLWRDSLRATDGFWLTGSGAGTFVRVETLGRTDGEANIANDHAHNEYLEALVEGGVARLALTLVLAAGLLVAVGRGYARQRGRPGGSLLLGAWFGLAAVAAHAVTDFGLHIAAVPVFAAILAGCAMAVSQDAEFARVRKKLRVRVRKGTVAPPPPVPSTEVTQPTLPAERSGFTAIAGAVVTLLAGFFVAFDTWTRARSETLLAGAEAFRASGAGNRRDGRIAYLTARTRLRPDDPTVWLNLAEAHVDAGSPADIRAALAALRTARDKCPLYPEVQFRLGLFARSFTTADPPMAYFDRAKRLLVMDPDVWFASGREALRVGDEPTAWTNFRQALALSRERLKPILAAVGDRLPPARLADEVLPGDPAVLMMAADDRYPDTVADAASRRPFLERAAAAADRPSASVDQLRASARALGELGRTAEAVATWRRAVALVPENVEIHDAFARWLEDEELYPAAVTELEWLAERRPGVGAFADRLLVAKHAAELQAAIAGK